jgi:hypothetical protein
MARPRAAGSGSSEREVDAPWKATERLGRSLKGRLGQRAIAAQNDPDGAHPFSFGELIAVDQFEARMESRRELERLRAMTRDPSVDAEG